MSNLRCVFWKGKWFFENIPRITRQHQKFKFDFLTRRKFQIAEPVFVAVFVTNLKMRIEI